MDYTTYMKMAIDLARKGCGFVSPNPMVGAVIVKRNEILGIGYHKKFGEPHAEVNAITNASESIKGSTLYVTLEPCCHTGKTSPCTDAIIKSGISRVVIGSKDPNPLINGNGIKTLEKHNIEVVTGVLEDECVRLNEIFFHYVTTKMPFVALKYAMSADGKIATATGDSKWISSGKSREHVHFLRHKYSAIMVGVNTVISDNPLLTCRIKNSRNPVRIICDTNLNTPLNSKIVKTASKVPTYIATCCRDADKIESYTSNSCSILTLPQTDKGVDLSALLAKLGELSIDSLLIEGGGNLNFSALSENLVDKIYTYISPKIIGGENAKTPVEGAGITAIDEAFKLSKPQVKFLGSDILIKYDVSKGGGSSV